MPRKKNTALKGNLSLLSGDKGSLTELQVQLLTAVDECGSISAAAKKIGISYKTAWDRINAMNNMSDKPLVLRSVGGYQLCSGTTGTYARTVGPTDDKAGFG